GLGGAGKTQIALKFIANSGSRFTNQLKINAGSKETIEASYKQIAMDKNLGDKADAAKTWLKANQDEWLILFDNADKLDLDLGEHIPKCKHGNVLITSRNPELWVHTGPEKKSIEISNLSVDDAVILLLKRSGLGHHTAGNRMHAVSIVKELYCFPLAIVQAGAFISKSPPLRQDISKYLELYQQNKIELLSKKPAQSPEDYEWTVYTTWQMSFSQLSSKARQFLQLCSFIHFEKISEDIFRRASEYKIRNRPLDPTQEQLQSAVQFLAQFSSRTKTGWNSLAFVEMISE
ncbi:P-loop containing nucleoside triphosphate hydrolase protein, partial [Mycena amicta]